MISIILLKQHLHIRLRGGRPMCRWSLIVGRVVTERHFHERGRGSRHCQGVTLSRLGRCPGYMWGVTGIGGGRSSHHATLEDWHRSCRAGVSMCLFGCSTFLVGCAIGLGTGHTTRLPGCRTCLVGCTIRLVTGHTTRLVGYTKCLLGCSTCLLGCAIRLGTGHTTRLTGYTQCHVGRCAWWRG